MDDLQTKTAKAIVNIFETGHLAGNYGCVTALPGDGGHLTYGRSQTTLASGGLALLIRTYCDAAGARYASELRGYLDRLQAIDLTLDGDMVLRSLLARAGADPVMQKVQDSFFDACYWDPAVRLSAKALKGSPLVTSLGIATVYDSVVHGSFALIRDLTNAAFVSPPGEEDWVKAYIAARRNWLATSANLLLRTCVYRMDELNQLAAGGNWDLALPIVVRGVRIAAGSFIAGAPAQVAPQIPERASAESPDHAVLRLRAPYITGDAVEVVQRALVKSNLLPANAVDGIYGPLTVSAVRQLQAQKGLQEDGIVGLATWAAVDEIMQ